MASIIKVRNTLLALTNPSRVIGIYLQKSKNLYSENNSEMKNLSNNKIPC